MNICGLNDNKQPIWLIKKPKHKMLNKQKRNVMLAATTANKTNWKIIARKH